MTSTEATQISQEINNFPDVELSIINLKNGNFEVAITKKLRSLEGNLPGEIAMTWRESFEADFLNSISIEDFKTIVFYKIMALEKLDQSIGSRKVSVH